MAVSWARVRRIGIAATLTAAAAYVGWSFVAFRATAAARAALESDARVTVTRAEGYWSFRPAGSNAVGLIFFPGGLVDPVAYAPLAHAIANAGYTVLLVEVPRRGAFEGAEGPEVFERARKAARQTAAVRRWVVAGHSRGGGVAATLVRNGFPQLAGLILIGTTYPRDFSLAALKVPVTRIYATDDTIASEEKLERTHANLPASTRMVRIDGGNHSQFGYYGFQPGDWPASITRDAQQAITRHAILETLAAAAARR
jgi:pimeloyl-ACP methyl ester carboxylesterase